MSDTLLGPTSSAERERDIDLVLITGAGASREFGAGGKPLPLMGDWSDAIIRKLSQRNGYLEATGLQRGTSGEEFEAQLGRFLRQVEAFPLIQSLLDASVRFQPPSNPALQSQGVLQDWHNATDHHLQQIVELIRQSLYEEFSAAQVDFSKATESYHRLFETLGLRGPSRWVYATTNYDVIGEVVIENLGKLPDWGVPPRTGLGGEVPIHALDILEGLPRYVPVLHLHGRVGWYRRRDNAGNVTSVYATTNTQHQEGFGIPVVMLPDPNKAYDGDDIISALWRQFREALQRAKSVLVLGHSLNDQALVSEIAANVQPLDRVGVTVSCKDGQPDEPSNSTVSTMQKIRAHLGTASEIPMRFGSNDENTVSWCLDHVRAWRERLGRAGLV